jgi:hypothetical protein
LIPDIVIASVGRPGAEDRHARLIESMYVKDPLAGASESFNVRDEAGLCIADKTAKNSDIVRIRGVTPAASSTGGHRWTNACKSRIIFSAWNGLA